ncbi:MAG: hypothetical protein IJU86_00270 [Firmicutes bacterium]|nr:hypothetical protein [Bacillota bacterium]
MKFIYIKNKNKYIKKIAREAFILFFKSLLKNDFYQLKNLDLKDNEKRKIWHNISKICHDLILGYEKQKIELILSAIKKINLLDKNYLNLTFESEE